MRVATLTTDNREHHRTYRQAEPRFGPAIEAVLQGFVGKSELEIHIISCTQQPMQSPEKLADNIWFHLLDVPKIGWLRTGYQGCIRAVRHKVRELQPDIVHGQGTERDCAISAVFSGFPNVVTIHGNMRSIAKITQAAVFSYDWCAARLERFTLPRTCGVLCNSAFTESVARPLARRTWRVPNALRREFFQPLPPITLTSSKPKILNIGAIVKHKRQLELLEVAEQLHQEGHSFELQFIGVANPSNKYAAMFLRRLEIAERRGFARYVETKSLPELIASLDAASALVHIPSAESFGLVVAEALSRNLKFFGTKIGGISDVAGGVEGAELVQLGDQEALASAIAKWLRAGCPQPKSAALEMQKRYHPEVIAQRHVEVYHEVLNTSVTGTVHRKLDSGANHL
jgi:glycosyltransferase involved in cell wall biosynthesis